jgi:hypothetical protein
MTMKSLMVTGALVLSSLSMGYAKTYDLVFSAPVKAGSTELKPGEYRLKVKGNTAEFTNIETEKTYSAPVKVQDAGKKHDVTAVDTNNHGTSQIQKIELGGSSTDLEF